jgi:hypothetical protein
MIENGYPLTSDRQLVLIMTTGLTGLRRDRSGPGLDVGEIKKLVAGSH